MTPAAAAAAGVGGGAVVGNLMISSSNGNNSGGAGGGGQFGNTTYTKVFVGGLAWETQKDTMKKYFEQFGDILEAVVITDKSTGRSKGYGFVTFREADAAMRACVDAAPVIDGRRANCNLASLGVQRSKPSTPTNKLQGGGRSFRVNVMGYHQQQQQGGLMGTAAYPSPAASPTFPHYAIHQGIPFNLYGYSPYSPDYAYATNYYNVYGGTTAGQYAMYAGSGGSTGMMTSNGAAAAAAFYPYLNYMAELGTSTRSYALTAGQGGYGDVHYPHHHHGHLYQYSPINSSSTVGGYPQQYYGNPISLATTPPLQSSGVNIVLQMPIPHH